MMKWPSHLITRLRRMALPALQHRLNKNLRPLFYPNNLLKKSYFKTHMFGFAMCNVACLATENENEPYGVDISELCKGGRLDQVLALMDNGRIPINSNNYACLLQFCIDARKFTEGRQIHTHMINKGFNLGIFIQNRLVEMYAKCGEPVVARELFDKMPKRNVFSWNTMMARYFKSGNIDDARQLFDKMPERDVVSWTTVISGYVQNGNGLEALRLFGQMHQAGYSPNQFTFVSVISACAALLAIDYGKQVHTHILRTGFLIYLIVGNSLIDMYAKCKHIEVARDLFDKMPERDEVSWSAMIAGYVQNGNGEEAFKLFLIMLEVGVKPNHFTFASALGACASLSAMEHGEQVHGLIIKRGYESNLFVGNALVDMYVKCGSMQCGFLVFEKMPKLDIISWTSLIVGYSQRGNSHQAVKLFSQMQQMGIRPDYVTFSSILSACANLATPEQGRQIHASAMKCVPGSNVVVGSALVNMYAKCGNVKDAHRVFDSMPEQNVVSWNAMIAGYGQNGQGKEALQLFERMLEEGIKPNDATFIGVISACCHAGLVEEGRGYFSSMIHDHSIAPRADHYACMVDLFGRAGHLEEAEDFINKMSFEPDASIWGALLNACRIHPNIEIGRRAADQLFVLEPQSAGPYVLLSNIFAAAGSWDDVAKVRRMMKDRGVRKNPGCSWIQINNRVHTFVAEDRSHPQTKEIYEMLEGLAKQLESAGYVADNRSFLNDIYEH